MLTSKIVTSLWGSMEKKFGSSTLQKDDSLLMSAVADILSVSGIPGLQEKEKFLHGFVTTIGKRIYITFEVGNESTGWDLWSQIKVCVHEHQHVIQGGRDGWITFCRRYMMSPTYRASYEAEAYGCDMEMEYWRTGNILDSAELANKLVAYGCGEEDVEMARRILDIRADMLKCGGIENMSSIAAIEFLESMLVD
jgi:hypothetical protein